MEKEIKELQRQVEDLKSELAAAMRREELLLNPVGGGGKIKQKIRRTKIGRIAMDPNSKLGKVVRSPRTIMRIVRHPGILKEIKNEKNKSSKNGEIDTDTAKPLFVPIKFFLGDYDETRINVVSEGMDKDLISLAIEVANKNNAELRVVSFGKGARQMEYRELVSKKKIPKAKRISFYSSVDQKSKSKIFELEVGKNDVFITRAWKKDGGE